MRRQNEVISSQQHSTTTTSATTSPPTANQSATPGLSLGPTNSTITQDSLNTPTTPLSRNPLQSLAAPPAPPPIAVPTTTAAFGYYNSNAPGTAASPALSYLHHQPAAGKDSAGHSVELDEYVDILQVQQLLLDSSAAAAATANPVHENQHPQQHLHQQQQLSQQQLAKPRPRINLQKASEYAAQLAQGKCDRSVVGGAAELIFWSSSLTSWDNLACFASRSARLSESLFIRQSLSSHAAKRGPRGPLVW